MAGDWIKLHRKSLQSAVFSDSWLWHLWSWCLMKANFRDGFFQGEPVKRGQFVTGRKTGSESLGVTESKWYRGMQKLEEFGNIKMAPNNRFTVVTVVNYSVYQVFELPDRTTDEQPANNKRTTDEQPANTIEERKEGKKERKKRRVFVKPSIEEVSRYVESIGKSIDAQAFHDYYESNGWKVSRNPMKDWQATARGWARRNEATDKKKDPPKSRVPSETMRRLINERKRLPNTEAEVEAWAAEADEIDRLAAMNGKKPE